MSTHWHEHPSFSPAFQQNAPKYARAIGVGKWLQQHQGQLKDPRLLALMEQCLALEQKVHAHCAWCHVDKPVFEVSPLGGPPDEEADDIGEKGLIKHLSQWIAKMKELLAPVDRTDMKVSVLDAKTAFRSRIHRMDLPISSILWNDYLAPALSQLGERATPKAIAEVMQQGLTQFDDYVSGPLAETDHYKDNRSTYAKMTRKDVDALLMTGDEFNAWLKEALEEARKTTEKAEEKAEKAKENAEENAKASRRQFEQYLQEWPPYQQSVINKIVDENGGRDTNAVIRKAVFAAAYRDASAPWERRCPTLTRAITESIIQQLPKEDSSDVGVYRDVMSNALNSLEIDVDQAYKEWQADKFFPDFHVVINAVSLSAKGVNTYTIVAEYLKWGAEVNDAIFSASYVPNQQYVLDKVLPQFKQILGSPELEPFYNVWVEQVKSYGKTLPTKDDLDRSWKETFAQLINKKGAFEPLLMEIADRYDNANEASSLSNQLLAQCSKDSIQTALRACRRPARKAPALGKGQSLKIEMTLSDGTLLGHTVFTEFDRVEGTVLTLPSKVGVNADTGTEGYTFGVVGFADQSPVLIEKGKGYVDLEYTVIFSKDRGSVTAAVSREVAQGQAVEETRSVYESTSEEVGKEQTEGRTRNNEVQVQGEGDLKKLFGVELGGGYSRSWGSSEETSTYEGTGREQGSEQSRSASNSYTTSQGASNSITVPQGETRGFYVFKLRLETAESTDDGTLQATLSWLVSPTASTTQGLTVTNVSSMPVLEMNWAR